MSCFALLLKTLATQTRVAKEAPVTDELTDLYACAWLVITTIMTKHAASQVNLYFPSIFME